MGQKDDSPGYWSRFLEWFSDSKTEEPKKYPRNDLSGIKGHRHVTNSDPKNQNNWRSKEEKEEEDIRKAKLESILAEEKRKAIEDEEKQYEEL